MSTQKSENQNTRILVCLSSSISNAKVIHAASKIAAAFHGTLIALFVETPAYAQMPDDDRKRLRIGGRLDKQRDQCSVERRRDLGSRVNDFSVGC